MSHRGEGAGTAAGGSQQRRIPAQQRSRARVDRILAVATELIAAAGSDQMTMSDVAGRADVSIGSLYQYFPDKSAILRSLAERANVASRRCIEEALTGVQDRAGLQRAFADLFDQYYALMLAEPVIRDIWSGMQADPGLRALELAESRACGAILAEAMAKVSETADRRRHETTAFLIWQLGEAAIRLAVATTREEGDAIVAAYQRMAMHEILDAVAGKNFGGSVGFGPSGAS